MTIRELAKRGEAFLGRLRRTKAESAAGSHQEESPEVTRTTPPDSKPEELVHQRVEAQAAKDGLTHDRSANLVEADAFGHMDYARAATDALVAADKTFTLGLFGDWGIGKTTIIGGIGELVRAHRLAFVNFDVWRFEGNALRRQFLRELAQQLKGQGVLPARYRPERELRDLEIDVPITSDKVRFSPWALVRGLILGLIVGGIIWWFLQSGLPDVLFDKNAKSSTAQEVGLLAAFTTFLYGALAHILPVEQRTITLQKIEEPERFYRKFVELLEKVETPRVVIAIDNLDRCSPKLVDEMLATIKTYLEPAQEEADRRVTHKTRKWLRVRSAGAKRQPADAVFVIAADDAAVRRHMTARELQSLSTGSATAVSEESGDAVEEAQRRVDEYLRKFFDASIRMRPILPEDLRSFATDELERFFQYVRRHLSDSDLSDECLSDEVQERLISLVVSALRRNPRRIKQFANSLETRLRTITAREESGGIPKSQRIGIDFLGVAKLAVIEEEWPDFYRELETNPRRLTQAQTEVATSDLGNPRLAAFLRDTRDVIPRNTAAVVNLKLESDEIELPEFGAFRDAIAYGDVSEAERIVAEAESAVQDKYAPKLPKLFAVEVARNAIAEARNVLAFALRAPPAGLRDDESRKRMLSDAINEPSLLTQLPLIDVQLVFQAMALLPAVERRRARQPFLDLATIGAQSGPAGIEAVAQQLAGIASELSRSERDPLRTAMAVEPFASQYRESTLPLIRADPSFLSDASVQSAWQVLSSSFDEQSPEFEVVTLGFSVGRGGDLAPAFLSALTQRVADAVSAPDTQGGLFDGVLTAVRRFKSPPEGELTTLVGTIQGNFPAFASSDAARATAFAFGVAESLLERQDTLPAAGPPGEQLAIAVTQQAPVAAAKYVTTNAGRLSNALKLLIVDQIEAAVPIHTEIRDRLVLLRGVLVANDGKTRVARYLRTLITETDLAALTGLIGPLSPELGEELDAILEDVYEFSAATPGFRESGIRPIVAVVRFGMLSGADLLADRWEELLPTQRAELRKALVRLLRRDEKHTDEVARIVSRLRLRAGDRIPLVRAFLKVARDSSATRVQRKALKTATELAKPSKRGRKLVQEARREVLGG